MFSGHFSQPLQKLFAVLFLSLLARVGDCIIENGRSLLRVLLIAWEIENYVNIGQEVLVANHCWIRFAIVGFQKLEGVFSEWDSMFN